MKVTKQDEKELTILILTYNRFEYTKLTMDSVSLYTDFSCVKEVLVGDAGSTDGTRELVEQYEFVDKVYDIPYGSVAKSLRRGAQIGTGKYIITLDNDMIVSEGWNRKALEAIRIGNDHGIRLIGYAMPTGRMLKNAVYGDPASVIPALRGKYLYRPPIHCDGFSLQPVWCLGGMRIANREFFLQKNTMGYLGDLVLDSKKDKAYFGFWYWQILFVNQLAALQPPLPILPIELMENLPPSFQYASHRLSNPDTLVQEALNCGPASLKKEYIDKGWMRDFDFGL